MNPPRWASDDYDEAILDGGRAGGWTAKEGVPFSVLAHTAPYAPNRYWMQRDGKPVAENEARIHLQKHCKNLIFKTTPTHLIATEGMDVEDATIFVDLPDGKRVWMGTCQHCKAYIRWREGNFPCPECGQ